MKSNRTVKVMAVIALFLSVIGTSISFAIISTTLTINGSSGMKNGKWEIYFDNLSAPTIKGDANIKTAPTLTNTHIGDYNITLTKPGDSVSYTFDVVNNGNMNAILGTYTKEIPTFTSLTNNEADETIAASNLVYTLTYTRNGDPVMTNDLLNAGEIKNLTLTIGYSQTATSIPTSDVDIDNLSINLIYSQN